MTFWAREVAGSAAGQINIWAIPTLGGEARPYLEGVAEFDWSGDGSRLVYHTPGPGNPMFVRDPINGPRLVRSSWRRRDCTGTFRCGRRTAAFIYFVHGSLPDAMDIWRIRPSGGAAERVTHHNARASHPVLLDHRTLLYLASDRDGDGPWLHSLDVKRGVSHRVSAGLERYSSLAASADGRRLVATLANPKGTLWRLQVAAAPAAAPRPSRCRPGADSRRGWGLAICSTSRQRTRATVSGNWSTTRRPSCGYPGRTNHRRARDCA